MASTALQIYAKRNSIVGVQRWIGGNVCYAAIKHWCNRDVQRDADGNLYLQTTDGSALVPLNSYIVLEADGFKIYNPDGLEADYVKIADQTM